MNTPEHEKAAVAANTETERAADASATAASATAAGTTAASTTAASGLSRRQAMGYAGAAAAGAAAVGLTSGEAASATAQAAAAGAPLVSRNIGLDQAERVLAAAVRYVRQNALPPMFVIVVDTAGQEKASRRMDGNGPASLVLAPIKARTSAAFRTSTTTLAARTTDPARIASFTAAGFSLLGGGAPLLSGADVIGAIGVGGGSPEQDQAVADAAGAVL